MRENRFYEMFHHFLSTDRRQWNLVLDFRFASPFAIDQTFI